MADAQALSEVSRESWSNAYRGVIPHLHLDKLVRARTPEWWSATLRSSSEILVLQVCGAVAGYATFGPVRARGRYEGEIYELYVAPTYQGLGFGELLFEACRYQLDSRQLKGLMVWALADNEVAKEFYLRRGGRPAATGSERFGSKRLKKIGYGWD